MSDHLATETALTAIGHPAAVGASPIDDSDDTEGRRLYRARANTFARYQIAMAARSVKLSNDWKIT